jgi:hypothetical protein
MDGVGLGRCVRTDVTDQFTSARDVAKIPVEGDQSRVVLGVRSGCAGIGTMMVWKLRIIASRAVDSQQTPVSVPVCVVRAGARFSD